MKNKSRIGRHNAYLDQPDSETCRVCEVSYHSSNILHAQNQMYAQFPIIKSHNM